MRRDSLRNSSLKLLSVERRNRSRIVVPQVSPLDDEGAKGSFLRILIIAYAASLMQGVRRQKNLRATNKPADVARARRPGWSVQLPLGANHPAAYSRCPEASL